MTAEKESKTWSLLRAVNEICLLRYHYLWFCSHFTHSWYSELSVHTVTQAVHWLQFLHTIYWQILSYITISLVGMFLNGSVTLVIKLSLFLFRDNTHGFNPCSCSGIILMDFSMSLFRDYPNELFLSCLGIILSSSLPLFRDNPVVFSHVLV